MLDQFKQNCIDFLADFFGVKGEIRKLKIKLDEKEEKNKVLLEQVNELQGEVDVMEEKLQDPTEYLKNLSDKEYPWFDFHELKGDKRNKYLKSAESLRRNHVFKNELNKFIAESAKSALYETTDYEDLLRLRSAVNTMKSFREHIMKDIPTPNEDRNNEPEDPHAPL